MALGIGVAFVAGSSSAASYRATQDLIYRAPVNDESGGFEDPAANLNRLAFVATRGGVPARVAEKLGESDAAALARRVTAAANVELGTLSITATGNTAQSAEQLADAFATEMVASLTEAAASERQTEIDRFQNQANDLQGQVAELDAALAANPESGALAAQREAIASEYSEALAALRDLTSRADPESSVTPIGAVTAVASSGGTSTVTRVVIAGFVGFLIGAGLALLLTRFDTRIRTKEEAEEAFGIPVIAEIPLLSRSPRQRHDIVSIREPESPGTEAYRSLRTSLVFAPRVRWSLEDDRARRARTNAGDENGHLALSHTLLVVSPGVGEGKSTTVANLAVAFAEAGKYVLVVSADLRRPMVDQYLGVDRDAAPGVSELLAGEGPTLVECVRPTSIPDVRIVPSGETVSNPGELLTHRGAQLLEQARTLADVVLIDSPPFLATDDTSPLISLIDDVLVVCRAGATTAEAARRTSELLVRLGANVAGVALVGVATVPTLRSYYRAYGRGRDVAPKKITRSSSEAAGDTPSTKGGVDGGSARARASDTA